MLDSLSSHSPAFQLPKSWYLLGRSQDIKIGEMREFELAGKTLLARRNSDGTLVVSNNRCPHLGARLVHGALNNDTLICPFHAWNFDSKGQCTKVPADPCSKGRTLRTYAAIEKWGRIFVSTDSKAPFAFPLFQGEDKNLRLVAGGDFTLKVQTSWDAVAANGFDVAHLKYVHGRHSKKPSHIEQTSSTSLKITHTYEVGRTRLMLDRLVRTLTDGECEMSYEVFGGNLIYISTRFKSFTNRLIVSVCPDNDGGCSVNIVCLGRKSFFPMTAIMLWLQGKLSRSFFKREAKELGDIKINPKRLHESDVELKKFYSWLGEVCLMN
jgi:phenylpropionate dioxygenase-like ring-hydroxylating dioxygenase large terminal subunit